MVYLSKIYTKTGDDGTTLLGDGIRVAKDHVRVEAYGAVDELNATIGLLLSCAPALTEGALVQSIANDLFDVGADLCVPLAAAEKDGERLRVTAKQVTRLEEAIDRLNAGLAPLTSFVLPGGAPSAAYCHLARAVCRRAERRVFSLTRAEAINPHVLVYLNRLSDLLFVLARSINADGGGDTLWSPGMTSG